MLLLIILNFSFKKCHTIKIILPGGQLPSTVAPPGIFDTLARQDRGHFQAPGKREIMSVLLLLFLMKVQSCFSSQDFVGDADLDWDAVSKACDTILTSRTAREWDIGAEKENIAAEGGKCEFLSNNFNFYLVYSSHLAKINSILQACDSSISSRMHPRKSARMATAMTEKAEERTWRKTCSTPSTKSRVLPAGQPGKMVEHPNQRQPIPGI